jgi:hypothetical protein
MAPPMVFNTWNALQHYPISAVVKKQTPHLSCVAWDPTPLNPVTARYCVVSRSCEAHPSSSWAGAGLGWAGLRGNPSGFLSALSLFAASCREPVTLTELRAVPCDKPRADRTIMYDEHMINAQCERNLAAHKCSQRTFESSTMSCPEISKSLGPCASWAAHLPARSAMDGDRHIHPRRDPPPSPCQVVHSKQSTGSGPCRHPLTVLSGAGRFNLPIASTVLSEATIMVSYIIKWKRKKK